MNNIKNTTAGAEIHSGDGGYSIGTKEKYDEFVKIRNERSCKTHPDAPHGFLRNASHGMNRYVCECEYWEEPKDE
jgi:hypothetical protein